MVDRGGFQSKKPAVKSGKCHKMMPIITNAAPALVREAGLYFFHREIYFEFSVKLLNEKAAIKVAENQ